MPLYAYKCPKCGAKFDRLLRLADYAQPQQCYCGTYAEKQVTAAAVIPDYAPYNCPVTGKLISGRRQHEENLKRQGCRVLETGESTQIIKQREAEERAFDKAVEETTEEFIAKLPAEKKDKLAAEVENGMDVEIVKL